MDITFHEIPQPLEIIVRQNGCYVGKLIRTNGDGPVWANRELLNAVGVPPKEGLTYDDPGAVPRSQIDIIERLRRQDGE